MNQTKEEDDDSQSNEQEYDSEGDATYNVNLFRVKASNQAKPSLISNRDQRKDFKVQVIVNNCLDTVIADTGARISVTGRNQALKWWLLSKMVPSKTRIKPYNSPTLRVHGEARCSVSFGDTSMPVNWHIISG